MKPEQPLKVFGEDYDKLALLRELEALHKRVNDAIISPAIAAPGTSPTITEAAAGKSKKANYVAGDVGTAANIASALNDHAVAVNTLIDAVNSLNKSLATHNTAIGAVTVPVNALLDKLNAS